MLYCNQRIMYSIYYYIDLFVVFLLTGGGEVKGLLPNIIYLFVQKYTRSDFDVEIYCNKYKLYGTQFSYPILSRRLKKKRLIPMLMNTVFTGGRSLSQVGSWEDTKFCSDSSTDHNSIR